jgi:hypothetical protein
MGNGGFEGGNIYRTPGVIVIPMETRKSFRVGIRQKVPYLANLFSIGNFVTYMYRSWFAIVYVKYS